MTLVITGDTKKIKQIKNIAKEEGLEIVYQSDKSDLRKDIFPNVYSTIFKSRRDTEDTYTVTLGWTPFYDENAIEPAKFIAKIKGKIGNMTDSFIAYSVSKQRLIELLNEQKSIDLNDDVDKIDEIISKL